MKTTIQFILASLVYLLLSALLFLPFARQMTDVDWVYPAALWIGACGGYLLSRRWVGFFSGGFLAGLVYGFGPFMLSLVSYHPSVVLLAALIGWLLLPAAYAPGGIWRFLKIPMALLPFLAIIWFFQWTADQHYFVMPIQMHLSLGDLGGLLFPLVMVTRNPMVFGFYHVSLACVILAIPMLVKSRRYGIMTLIAAGIVLACLPEVMKVSPLLWLSIPMLCGSVLAGMGLEAFVLAGYQDRKWVLAAACITGILALAALLMATQYFRAFAGLGNHVANLFVQTGYLYLLATAATATIFFLARAKIRLKLFRLIGLMICCGLDILIGAVWLIGHIMH